MILVKRQDGHVIQSFSVDSYEDALKLAWREIYNECQKVFPQPKKPNEIDDYNYMFKATCEYFDTLLKKNAVTICPTVKGFKMLEIRIMEDVQ